MGKPLVRFCEGQEINWGMEEILWHRRESRRKQRRQTSSCSPGRLLSTRKLLAPAPDPTGATRGLAYEAGKTMATVWKSSGTRASPTFCGARFSA